MAKTPTEIYYGDTYDTSHKPKKAEIVEWMDQADDAISTIGRVTDTAITTLAHRTARDIAPENTLAGIGAAYAAGFDGIEMDIQFTSDNIPVLLHDSSVDRTTSQTGEVSTISLATLQTDAYECGSHFAPRFAGCRIPRLQDALDEIVGKFSRVHLELKYSMSESQIDTILAMVVERNMEDQAIFISYNFANLEYVRSQNAKVGVGYIDAEPSDLATIAAIGGRTYCSVSNATADASPGIFASARALGIEVYGKPTNGYEGAYKNLKRGIRVIQSDWGIMARPRTPGGSVYKPCLNLAGAVLNINTAGSTITATDGIITIDSKLTGDQDTLNIPLMLYGGDWVYVEAYVKKISGDEPIFFIAGGDFGTPPQLARENTANDVYKLSGTLFMPGGSDGISNRALQIGYGSERSGKCEVFDLKIVASSRAFNFPDGSFHVLVDLENSGPVVNPKRPPRGIAGVFYPADANNNLVAVQLEGNNSNTFIGSAEIVGTTAGSLGPVARLTEYKDAGTVDPDYAVALIRVFDGVTGAPVNLTTSASMNLKVSG